MENSKNILEGVITFFNSTQTVRAEKVLKNADVSCLSIPGPREISPNCGVALAFDYTRKDMVIALLASTKNTYEAIHHYPEAKKIAEWL